LIARLPGTKFPSMLSGLLLALLIVVSIALTAVILLQRSEGGALGVGGGAGGGFMTARGTGDLLTRATSILGGAFFAICIALVFVGGERSTGSVTDRVTIGDIDPTSAPAQAPTPGAPAASAPGAAPGLPSSGLPSLQAPTPTLAPPPAAAPATPAPSPAQ